MPEFVLFVYSNALASGLDSYAESVQWASPQTATGLARTSRHQQLIAYAVPATSMAGTPAEHREAKAKLAAHAQAHPDMYSDAWCVNRLGGSLLPYAPVGQYFACTVVGNRIISDTRYTCPHCAMVATRDYLAARNQLARGASCMLTAANCDPPEEYLAPHLDPEISGEATADIADTSTIRDYTSSPGYACGNCGRLGHNSRGCEYEAKHFDRIGVEVEGRFLDLRAMKQKADRLDATYAGDGSIGPSPDSGAQGYEFKTKPGSLRETIEQVIALFPDETDKTCGMHIHMSFPQDCLTLLHTKAFFTYFKARWQSWGAAMGLHPQSQFFKRLNDENDYCLTNESVRRTMTEGERYEQLNFTAWRQHKTLECRLLPMFRRSSLAVAAIQELVAIYEDFLTAPELYGFVYPEAQDAGVDAVYLTAISEILPNIEIDLPAINRYENRHEMELDTLAAPAEGMVRIALPVNQPITVEALSTRLAALRVA